VGRIDPFRRRRLRGVDEFNPQRRIRFWPQEQRRTRLGRIAFHARPFVLLGALLTVWAGMDPALVEPPAFLSTDPERVSKSFTRCGPGRWHACVIDGDTFKLGTRKVRIIGIDAPETHPARCPEEARLGEQATAKLQELLNRGPFEMVGRLDGMKDRYGRDLRVVQRKLPDGSTQSIASEMRTSGLAHRYTGFKTGWC
jgi:hypothetical protein